MKIPVLLGLAVGIVWTALLGPFLRKQPGLPMRYFSYGALAVGAYVMYAVIGYYKVSDPGYLVSLLSAGTGMFLTEGARGVFNRFS